MAPKGDITAGVTLVWTPPHELCGSDFKHEAKSSGWSISSTNSIRLLCCRELCAVGDFGGRREWSVTEHAVLEERERPSKSPPLAIWQDAFQNVPLQTTPQRPFFAGSFSSASGDSTTKGLNVGSLLDISTTAASSQSQTATGGVQSQMSTSSLTNSMNLGGLSISNTVSNSQSTSPELNLGEIGVATSVSKDKTPPITLSRQLDTQPTAQAGSFATGLNPVSSSQSVSGTDKTNFGLIKLTSFESKAQSQASSSDGSTGAFAGTSGATSQTGFDGLAKNNKRPALLGGLLIGGTAIIDGPLPFGPVSGKGFHDISGEQHKHGYEKGPSELHTSVEFDQKQKQEHHDDHGHHDPKKDHHDFHGHHESHKDHHDFDGHDPHKGHHDFHGHDPHEDHHDFHGHSHEDHHDFHGHDSHEDHHDFHGHHGSYEDDFPGHYDSHEEYDLHGHPGHHGFHGHYDSHEDHHDYHGHHKYGHRPHDHHDFHGHDHDNRGHGPPGHDYHKPGYHSHEHHDFGHHHHGHHRHPPHGHYPFGSSEESFESDESFESHEHPGPYPRPPYHHNRPGYPGFAKPPGSPAPGPQGGGSTGGLPGPSTFPSLGPLTPKPPTTGSSTNTGSGPEPVFPSSGLPGNQGSNVFPSSRPSGGTPSTIGSNLGPVFPSSGLNTGGSSSTVGSNLGPVFPSSGLPGNQGSNVFPSSRPSTGGSSTNTGSGLDPVFPSSGLPDNQGPNVFPSSRPTTGGSSTNIGSNLGPSVFPSSGLTTGGSSSNTGSNLDSVLSSSGISGQLPSSSSQPPSKIPDYLESTIASLFPNPGQQPLGSNIRDNQGSSLSSLVLSLSNMQTTVPPSLGGLQPSGPAAFPTLSEGSGITVEPPSSGALPATPNPTSLIPERRSNDFNGAGNDGEFDVRADFQGFERKRRGVESSAEVQGRFDLGGLISGIGGALGLFGNVKEERQFHHPRAHHHHREYYPTAYGEGNFQQEFGGGFGPIQQHLPPGPSFANSLTQSDSFGSSHQQFYPQQPGSNIGLPLSQSNDEFQDYPFGGPAQRPGSNDRVILSESNGGSQASSCGGGLCQRPGPNQRPGLSLSETNGGSQSQVLKPQPPGGQNNQLPESNSGGEVYIDEQGNFQIRPNKPFGSQQQSGANTMTFHTVDEFGTLDKSSGSSQASNLGGSTGQLSAANTDHQSYQTPHGSGQQSSGQSQSANFDSLGNSALTQSNFGTTQVVEGDRKQSKATGGSSATLTSLAGGTSSSISQVDSVSYQEADKAGSRSAGQSQSQHLGPNGGLAGSISGAVSESFEGPGGKKGSKSSSQSSSFNLSGAGSVASSSSASSGTLGANSFSGAQSGSAGLGALGGTGGSLTQAKSQSNQFGSNAAAEGLTKFEGSVSPPNKLGAEIGTQSSIKIDQDTFDGRPIFQ
ncbi:hornerin-like [Phlebotomus argentipes]|uniref:hornerin-like n=1 Tax=Phlebotomus argentipes TaxID=94469 RepID=UPI00289382A0|nr:hornerin-like [Phlebotomus argentipes]